MNAFRQARALGTHLIAGVNSDASITTCKGRPLTNDAERLATVRGCRWVDAVVEHVPYVMNERYLHAIIGEHRLDAIVHGDDPCIVDGKNVYEAAQVTAFLCFYWCDTCYIVCSCLQRLGKYRTIPRTEGVSTTDIVGRILEHFHAVPTDNNTNTESTAASERRRPPRSNFLVTGRVFRHFSAHVRSPRPTERVVYIAGAPTHLLTSTRSTHQ
jgi:ethanolamine-phosphate cytidylyltransferase